MALNQTISVASKEFWEQEGRQRVGELFKQGGSGSIETAPGLCFSYEGNTNDFALTMVGDGLSVKFDNYRAGRARKVDLSLVGTVVCEYRHDPQWGERRLALGGLASGLIPSLGWSGLEALKVIELNKGQLEQRKGKMLVCLAGIVADAIPRFRFI